jgi:serine/threonine protein kinase
MREIRPQGAVYRNVRCVGHGQTATVFHAIREDSLGHSQQAVALKVLKNRTTVSWLRREFETLVRVNSPHCVKVLGWENLNEGSALVLEWIDGVTLLDFGKSVKCDEALISEVLAQVQDGLKTLHSCQLFHGDLSPSNILIDRNGLVRIVDFALAPMEAGVVNGTPAYLAPEIWTGSPPSFRADLFALGLIAEDLRNGFLTTPQSLEQCRKRSFQLAQNQNLSELLQANSAQRKPKNINSSQIERERLATEVEKILIRRAQLVEQTQALPVEPMKVCRAGFFIRFQTHHAVAKIVGTLLTTMMTTAASVKAQAPLNNLARPEQAASLCVRTQSWFELSLNGRPIGYPPLCIHGIKPGTHRLSWKTSKTSANLHLTLGPNENRQLSQSQLESLVIR